MYHDQGYGPVKVVGIEAGVNITVGWPIIRTSVDQGTAFDIAGSRKADSRSMVRQSGSPDGDKGQLAKSPATSE